MYRASSDQDRNCGVKDSYELKEGGYQNTRAKNKEQVSEN
jgi:hypothetical protein